jgi:hypothetical protein
MQPRIYTYKITFEEVPYYYYGSKKERYYNQEYWGSPKTNKWCWNFYTPKKQILEIFDYSDEGYKKCREIEDRLIKFFLNDKWCLNEVCGGCYSLSCRSKNGKKGGNVNAKNKTGVCGLSKEKRILNGKVGGLISGKKSYENKTGLFSLTEEQRKLASSKGGTKGSQVNKNNKKGIFALTAKQLSENGKKGGKIGGKKQYELGIGVHGKSKEERIQYASKAGKVGANIKWKCTETGYISNAGGLSTYQKKRDIDTSKRIKLDPTNS